MESVNTHVDKIREDKTQSAQNRGYHGLRERESALSRIDNRPESLVQRKLQALASRHSAQKMSVKKYTDFSLRERNVTQRAVVAQRLESEKAKAMLAEGIRELGGVRFGKNLAGVYSKIRAYGPPEGLTTLDSYKPTELGGAFGLTIIEEMALYAYSQPYKDDPNGAFFMGDHRRWGGHGNGWVALNAAIDKLPSFEELELGSTANDVVPTFRTERADSAFMTALPGKVPCYVLHGAISMGMTRHFASASVMGVSVHSKDAATLRFECPSAKFIQTFGGMSTSTDGGEILIPPGTITLCGGSHTGQFGPEYTLKEIGKETLRDQPLLDSRYPLIEDHQGKDVSEKYAHLYKGGQPPASTGKWGINFLGYSW